MQLMIKVRERLKVGKSKKGARDDVATRGEDAARGEGVDGPGRGVGSRDVPGADAGGVSGGAGSLQVGERAVGKRGGLSGRRGAAGSGSRSRGGQAEEPSRAAAGGVKFVPVTYSLDAGLIGRLEEWAHRKRLTKSAAVRELLGEALK